MSSGFKNVPAAPPISTVCNSPMTPPQTLSRKCAQADARLDLVDAWLSDMAADGNELGSGAALGADCS